MQIQAHLLVSCQDITVYLDASGNASISVNDINGGSSDACGVASSVIDNSTFTCNDLGANTVILTVTDINGNVASCSSTVTVIDSIAPVLINIPADVIVSCDAIPSAASVTSSDNCSSTISFSETIAPVDGSTNGLKGYFAFEEGIGLSSADLSGNGSIANLTSSVGWTTGHQTNGGVNVNGTANSYVEIPNGTGGALDAVNAISIFASYNPTSLSGSTPIIQYNPNGWGVHLWDVGSGILFVRFTHRSKPWLYFSINC